MFAEKFQNCDDPIFTVVQQMCVILGEASANGLTL